jgi:ribosome-binding protein aMBF1 (putative translation factor)
MSKMEPEHYMAARETLGWTHQKIADTIGVDLTTVYRYQRGDVLPAEPTARLLRLLVRLRLTIPRRKFEQLVEELRK